MTARRSRSTCRTRSRTERRSSSNEFNVVVEQSAQVEVNEIVQVASNRIIEHRDISLTKVTRILLRLNIIMF